MPAQQPTGNSPADRLAAELRAMRDQTGFSLKGLESQLHVSDSSLSRYLSGQLLAPWDVVERLCRLAGRAPGTVRPLWDQADLSRRGAGAEPEPEPDSSAPDDPERDDLERDDPELSSPERAGAPGGSAPRWWRRHPRAAVLALVVVTAVVAGAAGGWVGYALAPRATLTPDQDLSCADWPWPPAGVGQVVVPPAHPLGATHTPTVELVSSAANGVRLVWARMSAARYGDRVWVDWTANGGQTWTQCGPFTTTGATLVTRAHTAGPGWQFRACGDTPVPAPPAPRNACTGFW